MLTISLHVPQNMNEIGQIHRRTQTQKIRYHMIEMITRWQKSNGPLRQMTLTIDS